MAVPPCGRPTFEALADVFTRHRGDRRVTFELELTNREKPVRIQADVPQVRVRPSERLVAEVERICGAGSVSVAVDSGATNLCLTLWNSKNRSRSCSRKSTP